MCYGQMFEDALRKARKPHWCDFCRKPIAQGERYHYQSGVTSDGFYRVKHHASCVAVERAATDHWRQDDYCEPIDRRQYAQEHARDVGWRDLLARVRKVLGRASAPSQAQKGGGE